MKTKSDPGAEGGVPTPFLRLNLKQKETSGLQSRFKTLAFGLLLAYSWAGHVQAAAPNCQDEASFPLISKKELSAAAEAKTAFIIDVNSSESFDKVHVPGAIHYASHKKDLLTLLPKDKSALVVAYCGGVQCNAWHMAAEVACKNGYTNVRHFKEGIQGWVAKD
jgi:rhodanese-related sulfurtransferase